VDVGAYDLALLNFTSFEGATKRNRPNVKIGDLVYGMVSIASKNLDPEVK
jgi:exosome complex component RRP40